MEQNFPEASKSPGHQTIAFHQIRCDARMIVTRFGWWEHVRLADGQGYWRWVKHRP